MEKQRAMEEALRIRSDHQQQHRSHGIDEEEKRLIDSDHHAHDNKEDETVVKTIGNKRPYSESNDVNPSSPKQKHLSTKQEPVVVSNMEKSTMEFDHTKVSSSCQKKEEDDQLESARAEMGEVREENQRLKIYLNRIMKDYKTLQMQFYGIVQQEATKPTTDHSSNDHHQEMEEEPSDDLVSLSLGRSSSDSKKHEDQKNKTTHSHDDQDKGLTLGLDYRKFEASKSSDETQPLPNPSPENSSEDQAPKEEAGETWPPSKVLKMMKSSGEDVILQQNAVKKARVSVRARCDTPTMNDGCQWRKYGQKISKGNPCPRAYYRCTVAPSCPVRKQVQRCAEDMSILITTYEGNHNHPLAVSATAMASTTSAAASMLLSGSSSSSHPASSTAANLHGLNFYLSDNSKTKQFYLPNSSLSAPSHPTITLDLTTAPSSSSSSHYGRFATANYPPNPRYNSSTTSLNFGSSSEISSNNNSMPWGSTTGLLSYGSTTTQPFIKNQIGSLNLARQQQQQPMESYMQQQPPKNNLPDPIAAATKAITADPSFQSALAAALTSIIGGGGGANHLVGGGDNNNNNFGQKLKWGDQKFPALSSGYTSPQAVMKGSNTNIGCASSFLNNSSATTNSTQPGSMIFLQPAASLPFSTSNKSSSSSPGDHKEQSH
ncbi:hypothetical protein Ddye_002563 [Dipteronia dyeriana]|uniref:WRKY domain-containing protein n=1 Tax=Dipteronia dyeriana TaxID=168575 RepID=A0AAD9XR01_9ROSI|nr:hypothetical protein Ddye_002549 [Dipteronia dyeriana]KAK2663989.1 hypothetical protein Ddye_002563 [Dipteronia dyeriana]